MQFSRVTKVSLLAEHLRLGASTPFVWGLTDCFLWAADWTLAQRGLDPAEPWRGRYSTALGAKRAISRVGGYAAGGRVRMASLGFSETSDPQPGDIGLVQPPDFPIPVLAIRTRVGWACKGQAGLVTAPLPLIVAWTV